MIIPTKPERVIVSRHGYPEEAGTLVHFLHLDVRDDEGTVTGPGAFLGAAVQYDRGGHVLYAQKEQLRKEEAA